MTFLMHDEIFQPCQVFNLEHTMSQWENWGQKRAPVSFGRDRVCITCPPKDQSSWNTKMMQPKEGFALAAGPRPPRVPAVLRMPESNVNHLQPRTSPTPRSPQS